MKKFFLCLFGILFMWVAIFIYNKLTDGFSIHQMTSSLPQYPQFDVALNLEKKDYLQNILNQKFYYLGKGCQFYVFESENKEFVIKFLKHKHLRLFPWLKSIPMPKKLRLYCDDRHAKKEKKIEQLFTSCKIAYEKIPEETGLVFIHLNRIPALEKKIILIDKIGCRHTIEVDNYEYFIQKKGVLISQIFAISNVHEILERVRQLTDLIIARCEKGIRDRDQAFAQNIAFIEQRAIFTDFGQFYEDPSIFQVEEQRKEIKKRMDSLQVWTKKNFPDFIVDEIVKN